MQYDKWSEPKTYARERLNEICRKSEAYVGTPEEETNRIDIWGTQEQASRAARELEGFEKDVRARGIRPSNARWHKEMAFDGRTQSRLERAEDQKGMGEALKQLAMQEEDFGFEAYLLWPDHTGLDINVFIAKHDSGILDDIRRTTFCRIDFNTGGVKSVKISTQDEDSVRAIYLRVFNLVKEMVAGQGRFIKANRFKLPRPAMYRDRVGWDQDPTTRLFLPTFHGEELPESEVENWNKLCKSEDKKNRDLIRAAMDMCLKSLHAPQRHVRMRVTFAELGFHTIRQPLPGKDYVMFDDFCEMISKEMSQVRPIGLRSSAGDLADLADVLSDMPEFGKPTIHYVLHFDFVGRNQTTLRLETEHKLSLSGKEAEMVASRWLEFGKSSENDEILELNMLDIEHLKSNFQIHIGAAKLHAEEKGTAKSQATFVSNLGFDAAAAGFKAPPRRRAQYPPGRTDLMRVEEITIARFPFKSTDGTFEIHRKDVFDELHAGSLPTDVKYEAKYYYREWDMLMAEFANIKPGEEVSWNKDLSGFFRDPKSVDDTRPLPMGLKAFVKEIEEISALLGQAIESLPDIQNGTNGSHSVECP